MIWYASYGSNLLRARFMAYIQGGSPPGESFAQVGCTDPTPPRDDRPMKIPHRLYFAQRSRNWENGGVCFIQRKPEPGVETLGRMYLVTEEQYKEVFYQENGWNGFREERAGAGGPAGGEGKDLLRLDLDRVPPLGAMKTAAPGWYSTILHLGEHRGHPIFTFTASWDESRIPHTPPGPRYRDTVARGIRERYGLPEPEIQAYLERWSPGS